VEGEDAIGGRNRAPDSRTPRSASRATRISKCPAIHRPDLSCAFFATVMGFALIWHIWWMVAAGFVGAVATFVVLAWRDHDEYVIPAAEVRTRRPGQSGRSGAPSPASQGAP